MENKKPEDYFRSFQKGLSDFGQKVNDMVDGLWDNDFFQGDLRVPTDIFENDDFFIVEVEIPGATKKDVSVQIVDDHLSIKGKKAPKDREDTFEHQQERRFGEFIQTIPLPAYIELDSIKAKYEEGLLRVKFKKNPIAEEDKQNIDIE